MANNLHIRVATLEDEASVSALLKASYTTLMPSHYEASLLEKALPLIARANPDLLASGTYYIVENTDGKPLGCGGWTHERPGTGEIVAGLAHIRHFATHPNFLEKGIGRQLFTACVTDAQKKKARQMMCFSSLNAVSFYAALGFQTIEQVDIAMGPSLVFPSVLMEATL